MRASKMVLGAVLAAALPLCGMADGDTSNVQDSYIYWMVDQPSASAVLFDFARMVAADGSGSSYATEAGKKNVLSNADKMSTLEQAMNIGTDYGAKSFFIELFAFNSDKSGYSSVAQSAVYRFADCMGHILDPNSPNPQTPTAMTVSAFTIPEPTSGLLMLLGFAALGLKRKQV